jgi:hypothetical protein
MSGRSYVGTLCDAEFLTGRQRLPVADDTETPCHA